MISKRLLMLRHLDYQARDVSKFARYIKKEKWKIVRGTCFELLILKRDF
jgi:hypothetical protein